MRRRRRSATKATSIWNQVCDGVTPTLEGKKLGFRAVEPAGAAQFSVVQLVPGDERGNTPAVTALGGW